jgi:ubiquinone/menaquinone biosynthesis C-methylase UbiE
MKPTMQPATCASVGAALIVALATISGSVLASSRQAGGPDPGALKVRMEQAVKRGDLAGAAALADQLIDATEPAHVEALYAAAQIHARLGHRELAYLLLWRATGAGFPDRSRLLHDDAFAGFRDEDLFTSLARRAWARGYTDLLERPNREDVQKSPEIMRALAFRVGERVADIGAGTGYFTFQVADAVGPTGRVLALDIAPEMLEYLDFRVKARKAANISLGRVAGDDPRLEPGSVDTILMIDTIHYVKDRVAYAKKLRSALAPNGRVVIIDYRPKPMSERPWGPTPEQQFPREQMDREMAVAGFKVSQAFEFLPEQFFVIYVPQQGGSVTPPGPPGL